MKKTFTEAMAKYTKEDVNAFMFGFNDKKTKEAVIVIVPMVAFDEDIYKILINNDNVYKATYKAVKYLENCYEVARCDMEYLETLEGSNLGYKAETLVFGKPNHSDSLIDGVWKGYNVQMKTSFTKGNGVSTSNEF